MAKKTVNSTECYNKLCEINKWEKENFRTITRKDLQEKYESLAREFEISDDRIEKLVSAGMQYIKYLKSENKSDKK